MRTTKTHFILIHGAAHGAWCWYKLVPLLKLAGHHVTALDLGASGVNPKQLNELVSVYDSVQPLMEFMASAPQEQKVILVGHSYGGIAISLAMERFPEKISVAVFITSYMPNCIHPPAAQIQEYFKKTPLASLLDCKLNFDESGEILSSASLGPNYLKTVMYQNCETEDIELAKLLIRPFKFFLEDLGKEPLLTEAKYGKVKRVFVVCEEDTTMSEEFQQWIIENSPPTEVKFFSEADHMVMLSKPKQLCQCFQEIVERYL